MKNYSNVNLNVITFLVIFLFCVETNYNGGCDYVFKIVQVNQREFVNFWFLWKYSVNTFIPFLVYNSFQYLTMENVTRLDSCTETVVVTNEPFI